MEGNLKDILSHLSTEVDQETLLLYLQGKLSPEKQHEVEKHIMENEFAADALEGLKSFGDKEKLTRIVEQLNHDLKKKTAKRKRKKEMGTEPWLVIALVMILILIVISYLIIHQQLREG